MITRRTLLILGALSAMPRPAVSAGSLNVIHDAKPFAQKNAMSCWAAAAVILLRWKNGIPVTELDVAKMAGNNFVVALHQDTGLLGSEFKAFASALGLVTEAPQNYTPSGYAALLKTHGPLWVGSRLDKGTQNSRRHVRVLRGITGDGTFENSTAWVLDPDGGRDYQVTVAKFASELEEIAKEEIGVGNELFPQVIHFP